MKNLIILLFSLFLSLTINFCHAQADLKVSNLTGMPSIVTPGEVYYYTFNIENIGNQTAWGNYTIRKYLAPRSLFKIDEAIEVGYVPTGNTPVGTLENVVGGITIPESIPTDYIFFFIVIDAENQISESNENNNILRGENLGYPYVEEDCKSTFGENQEFLCHNDIENGYEIFTGNEGVTLRHTTDYNGNVLSTEVYEVQPFPEPTIDIPSHIVDQMSALDDVPIGIHDDYFTIRSLKLSTGNYVFYQTFKTYPPGTFTSGIKIIITNESFEPIFEERRIINDLGSAPNDLLEGIYATNDGGFYVNYVPHLPTWQNSFYSYLLKYDAAGNSTLEHFEMAHSIKLEKTPCGYKTEISDLLGGVYSGVDNSITNWNNNVNTTFINNQTQGRFGVLIIDASFINTNIRTQYNYSSNPTTNHVSSSYSIFVTDEGTTTEFANTGISFSGPYLFKGEGASFLYFSKESNGHLTLKKYPCDSALDCQADTDEIESLDFTALGSFDGSEYFISNTSENFYSIQAFLDEYGYNLVSINNAGENDFIFGAIDEMTYLGLNDADYEGLLAWNADDNVSFMNFDTDCNFCGTNNEPNDHVVMNHWNGEWSWVNAWSRRPFIIEVQCDGERPSLREAKPIPNPVPETKKTVGVISIDKLFPNPSSDFINVQISGESTLKNKVAIYNTVAQRLYAEEFEFDQEQQVLRIDVSQFLPGIYFLHFTNGVQKQILKFVKE